MGSWKIVLKRTCKWMACPCGKSTNLRNTLGAAYMRDCFRAQAFGERKTCSRRTSPPSCSVIPTAWFWCTWMNTGLCVQTHTSGEVPWEYLQSFLVSRSWQPTLTFHPSKQKCSETCRRPIAQMCGQGAPAHGRHRHGEWGNSASRGNITRFARTRFAEIPPCRLAHSIQRDWSLVRQAKQHVGKCWWRCQGKAWEVHRVRQSGVDGWHSVGEEESNRPALRNSRGWWHGARESFSTGGGTGQYSHSTTGGATLWQRRWSP